MESSPYAFLFTCSESTFSNFKSINIEIGKKKKNPLTALELNLGTSSQHVYQNTYLVCVLVKKQLVT